MGILNIGTNALLANMVALQTVGNNIANVNTPGYSGQTVLMQAAPSQYTGNGYIGEGVGVQTIKRNYDVRALRDDAGNIELYYSFPTQNILVIAESPYSFAEILNRLQAARKI